MHLLLLKTEGRGLVICRDLVRRTGAEVTPSGALRVQAGKACTCWRAATTSGPCAGH